MKQANNNQKLDLQKKTIKKLSVANMAQIQGGASAPATVPPQGTR
jgi:hypothetical protein